jgi:iron(III) transport system substrate-binding protein
MSHFMLPIFALIAIILTSFIPAHAEGTELVVYTSRNEHLIKDIFEQYQKKTGVQVRYRTGEAGALIQALISEGERTPADIFMTVDAGNLWFAASQGLLTPIDSPSLVKAVPAHLRDRDNHWFGLSVRARTLVYHSEKISKDQLPNYEDLALPEWKGRLCLRTSRKVYNQSLVAMLMNEHGNERALEIVKGWVANAVDIFSNDTGVMRAILAGQCDVGIVNTYYYGRLMANEPTSPLSLHWPNQGTSYGVHINISGAGITKHSKNKEAAQAFLEWLASAEAQQSFAQVNLEYAILEENVQQHPLVQSWGTFKPNTTFDLSEAGRSQQEVIQLIHNAGYR